MLTSTQNNRIKLLINNVCQAHEERGDIRDTINELIKYVDQVTIALPDMSEIKYE